MHTQKKCAVIGYGSWATTLVRQLAMKGIEVNWHVTNTEIREGLLSCGRNTKYIRDVEIDMSNVIVMEDINESVRDCHFVLLACPSAYLVSVLEPLTLDVSEKFFISAIKGIVPAGCLTVLEYVNRKFGLPFKQLGLISGPTHAEEVSRGGISYMTAAGAKEESALEIAALFSSERLKIDLSTDIYGIEYAGVLKNIYAIMSGMATGLGYGDNFIAVLVAKAAEEMDMFLDKSYPFDRKVSGRAYLGDLLVTCYSNFSRNRRFGQLVGKGCTVKSALNEMTMVAEGYYSCALIMKLCNGLGIEMPVAHIAYDVLYNNASPRRSFEVLSNLL